MFSSFVVTIFGVVINSLFDLLTPLKMSVIHSFHHFLCLLPGIDSYRRLSLAGDIKAAQKLAALTGEGNLAMRGDAG